MNQKRILKFICVVFCILLFLTSSCGEKAERDEISGITGVTKGSVDLAIPPSTPPDEVWRYGLGFPFQVAPDMAALFVNIRKEGTGSVDYEIGTDVILFDDLANISAANAIEVSRYERGVHGDSGKKTITLKGPVTGGFVPLGAKQADGSDHPHAGTGFGMCWVITEALDLNGKYNWDENLLKRRDGLFQFAYDGKKFQILKKELVKTETLLPDSDWNLEGDFLANAIPDGSDLLFAMGAWKKPGDIVILGVTRWRHGSEGWLPISFTPVTGPPPEQVWTEPSLIRDVDGHLLLSARSGYHPSDSTIAFDIAVWRSTANGQTWKQVIYRKKSRSRGPVTINQAADGTPFIVANYAPLREDRDILCYWSLNAGRTDLGELKIARDARGQFGPPPRGLWWNVDHPTSAIVRLADRKWHSLLVYRILEYDPLKIGTDPAPQTGFYIEEVFSRGETIPAWKF